MSGELHVQKGGSAAWWNCCPNAKLNTHDYTVRVILPGVTIRYVCCSRHVDALCLQIAGDVTAGWRQLRAERAAKLNEQEQLDIDNVDTITV